jgi:hypothetical protein
VIGSLLSLDKGLVRRQFKWGIAHPHGPGPNGRPPLLSPQQKDQFFEAISMTYINRIPWTLADVSAYIVSRFFIQLNRQTMHEILKRDSRLKSCRGIPMEDKRTEVTEDAILDFFRRAIEATDGVPSYSAFNMDEMGHQDWADRGEQISVVPAARHDDYDEETLHIH